MKVFEAVIILVIVIVLVVFHDSLFGQFQKQSEMISGNIKPSSTVRNSEINQYSATKGINGVDAENSVKVISTDAYSSLVSLATNSTRRRRMVDLTQDPTRNSMQTLINTW